MVNVDMHFKNCLTKKMKLNLCIAVRHACIGIENVAAYNLFTY